MSAAPQFPAGFAESLANACGSGRQQGNHLHQPFRRWLQVGYTLGSGVPRVQHAPRQDQAHMPRVAEMPWSMPALDERQVQADPQLYCMASGDGADRSCTCLTDQGTRYRLELAKCERIARYGPAYNPYRDTRSFQPQQPVSVSSADIPSSAPASPGVVIEFGSGQRGDVFPSNPAKTIGGYTPPTSTL